MLFKIIGSLMVITASTLLGAAYAGSCSRRPQQIRILQGLLQMLENEISYMSQLLAEAFERISSSTDSQVAVFFGEAARHLRSGEMNASDAWELSVDENACRTALNSEDINILASFGKMLGSTDTEGQVKNIRLTVEQLKLQELKAEESRKKNEAMYRNLGILGGIAIVIILL